jgi:hypothetical protein
MNLRLLAHHKILILFWIVLIITCKKDYLETPITEIPKVEMATYYVATNGNDSNPGTLASPWKTWYYGIGRLVAGDILYIRAGTYTEMQGSGGGNLSGVYISGRSGTAASRIRVSAYPGDARPVLDCSALSPIAGYHRGILMSGVNYWDFYGLILKNVREYTSSPTSYTGSGWEIQTGANINIEYCDLTYCMNGFTLNGLITNLNYINCDAYENWDIYQGGDLCNGYNGNISNGSTVNYIGCRAWKNCDDGFDNMAGGGKITYRNCWAFNNKAWHGGDSGGNGDGFKLGFSTKGYEAGVQRTLYNCISAYNGLMGYDESADASCNMAMAMYNCVSYNNADYYSIRFNSTYNTGIITLRNNISIGPSNLYAGRAANIHDHNTWNGGVTASTADFVSVDMAQLSLPRKADGSLPDITAFHLITGSDLINAGDSTGIYATDGAGNAWATPSPSMGAYEFGTTPPVTIPVTAVTVTGAGGATTITVDNGTLQMLAHVDPHTATDQTVVWSVINIDGEATINPSGVLTAVTDGTVRVKAISNG